MCRTPPGDEDRRGAVELLRLRRHQRHPDLLPGVSEAAGAWPLDDRGAAYGDGLFETLLVRDGRPLLWDEHLARLARGCHVLGIPMPAEHDQIGRASCRERGE